jgi:hypothetical protein
VPAQIERKHAIRFVELLQLIFPIGGAPAEAVDEDDGRCFELVALLRAGVDHAHLERLAIGQAVAQRDRGAMEVDVECHVGIVAKLFN